MSRLEAIVFDADGTLLDSFELIYSAYLHVAQTHQLRVPTPEEIRAQMGKPLPSIFEYLYPDEDILTLLNTNNTYVAANTMMSMAFDGVDELLSGLSDRGIKMAILTSGGSKVNNLIERHGWSHYFSSIVHHERIANPKPHSEGFVLAARECKVEPHLAMMVGDTVVDINTGKNAGSHSTVAITHGYGLRLDLEAGQPDYIVDTLAELGLLVDDLLAPR